MNCLIFLALLFCLGNNNNGEGCGCRNGRERSGNGERRDGRDCDGNRERRDGRERDGNCDCGNVREREGGREREEDRGCGCVNARDSIRNDDCGYRSDVRPEPRLEPRSFISYPGQGTCGCEATQSDN